MALIFDAVDRAQRSFKDTTILDDLRKQKVIELHFLRDAMIIGENCSAMDVMRWDYAVLAAKAYVTSSSENVKRSYHFKLENGEIVGEAPLGYLNVRDEHDKSMVIIDKERAPLVKKCKEWGLTSKRYGKPINKAQIHRMLKPPLLR
ncbi:MAG: hypothetical protein IJ019_06685 [Alphaproteobacteria bacterium]|nr:hypothetical protein [Alphaproteobacteria bacterium]